MSYQGGLMSYDGNGDENSSCDGEGELNVSFSRVLRYKSCTLT